MSSLSFHGIYTFDPSIKTDYIVCNIQNNFHLIITMTFIRIMFLDIYHKLYYLNSVPWIFFSNNPEVFAVIVNCTYCTCTLISFVIYFFYLITFYRNHGIRLGRIFYEMGISLISFSIT